MKLSKIVALRWELHSDCCNKSASKEEWVLANVDIYLFIGFLLLLAVFASKASGRAGVPALILFLGIGMIFGEEGLGGVSFNNLETAQTLGITALVFILFAGGLHTNFSTIPGIFKRGLLLSTLGVLLTSLLVGIFSAWLLPNFSLLDGMLLGAIISSTDAAAVFAVLRSKGVSLKGRLKPILEFESGSNDPMAVFLTVGLLQMISLNEQSTSFFSLIPLFVQQMAVGGALGILAGKLAAILINRSRLQYEGLYPVLTIGLVLLTYGGSQVLGGNGFLAVYLTGLFLGRERFALRRTLSLFHDGVAWLMQIAMFLTLGLLVYPSRIIEVAGWGLLLSIFLIFVARPLATHLLLWRSSFSSSERHLISWVGLRGAVPIILATYPFTANAPQSETIFNMVFFIVLTSVLLQGTTIPWVARRLGVEGPRNTIKIGQFDYSLQSTLDNELCEVEVAENSSAVGRNIAELALPGTTLIALVQRSNVIIIPRGSTVIEAHDRVLILTDREQENIISEFFGASTKNWTIRT